MIWTGISSLRTLALFVPKSNHVSFIILEIKASANIPKLRYPSSQDLVFRGHSTRQCRTLLQSSNHSARRKSRKPNSRKTYGNAHTLAAHAIVPKSNLLWAFACAMMTASMDCAVHERSEQE
jgi:hypothetical protein